MSDEKLVKVVEVSEEVEAVAFDKASAVEESTRFLKELLLVDPQTQNELFVATNVQMNEDGSVSVICVEDIDSDKAVMHTIYSGYVDKQSGDDIVEEDSDIIASPTSGKIVGLDGQPLV